MRLGKFKLLKIIFLFSFLVYLLCLLYLTFFDHIYGRQYFHRSINIIPFKTIVEFLTTPHNLNSVITNIPGNIEAFIPMGLFLPLLFKKMRRFQSTLLVVLFTTISIETIQFVAGVGSSDIDDVILNLFGGILGYMIYWAFRFVIGKRIEDM